MDEDDLTVDIYGHARRGTTVENLKRLTKILREEKQKNERGL